MTGTDRHGAAGLPALPAEVRRELDHPGQGRRHTLAVQGVDVSVLEWGQAGDRPVLLVHGARGSARVWWRVGPALAVTGRHVIAPDLPGHGQTPAALHLAAFRSTAGLVAELARARGVAGPGLDVVGTSWGALVAAWLPAVGLSPRTLVLIEPPVIDRDAFAALSGPLARLADAANLGATFGPGLDDRGWSPGERDVAAESAAAADPQMLRAIMGANGAWDGGWAALNRPEAAGVDVWVIRGDPALGGLTPDAYAAEARRRWPADQVISIAGAGHVPHRSRTAETMQVLLRALAPGVE